MMPELIIIMPFYNEQASLKKVVTEWIEELENWIEHFTFLAINDGSTDHSLQILEKLQKRFGNRLEIIDKPNQGHGQSCLVGYREAIDRKIPWVFQLDSDGQCSPEYFYRLWRERDSYDVLYGVRTRRDDGFMRVIASKILRGFLFLFFGCWCIDANVPYRLMRVDKIGPFLRRIPKTFFLANVALSLLLKKNKTIRHFYVSIRFRERYGGEPSVKMSLFGKQAIKLYKDLKSITND